MEKIKIFLLLIFIILLLSSCSRIKIIKNEINRNLNNKVKIVHISDLHIKRDKKIYQNLIKIINNIDLDLLLITGDTIDNNILHSNAVNFLVEFFDGDPDVDGEQIGGNITVSELMGGEEIVVNTSWAVEIGPTNVFVRIDYLGVVDESDESNNLVNNTLNIDSYQTIYGNSVIDLILGDSEDDYILGIFNITNSSGIVFVADEDNGPVRVVLAAIHCSRDVLDHVSGLLFTFLQGFFCFFSFCDVPA